MLRTVVKAQDVKLLKQRGQLWFENFKEIESDGILSIVGRKRLWQFKGLQVQMFVTIPEGTWTEQKAKLD